jgi:PAS domain S-box-containing protein
MLGYEPGEFPRTLDGWAASVHPEDVKRVMAAVQAHLERHAVYEEEYRVRTKDGAYRWWSARGAAARTPDGKPVRWIGSITNITERKQAEETLRESEAKYRTLIENIPQKILMKDRSCRWVSINKNLAHDFGFRPEEVVGKVDADLFPPDLAAKYHADDVRIMDTGKAEELEERYIQEGRETWVNTIKTPVRGANGEIVGVLGIFWDMTERKRAEEALRESESRFRQLAESLPQLVWTCQPDGPCDYLNRQWVEFTGVPEAQQHGFGWLEQLHPDDRAPTVAAWEAAVASGSDFRVEFRIRRHDGEYRWFDTQAVRLRDAGGHTVKWFGSNTDMTERRRVEEEIRQLNAELEQRVRDRTAELEAANKELETFSYSVSHDLRAPLRGIDGFSRILLEKCSAQLDDEGKDSLQRVRAASQRMGELIDDLLTLSRATRAELRRTAVDLTALAGEIVAELERVEPTRRVRWVIAPGLAATGDRQLLRVVLDNLLNNAWKFTSRQAEARIEFGAMKGEQGCAFFVRDNGVGFDMAYAGKLFGAFQRLHATADFPGTGIGLATVQRIIHRHGGRVWAEGQVNHGATFYFTLPETSQQP